MVSFGIPGRANSPWVIEGNAFRCEVIGANDGRVTSRITAADIAFFQYRDIRNTVIACELVGGRQPMSARADNYHVIV